MLQRLSDRACISLEERCRRALGAGSPTLRLHPLELLAALGEIAEQRRLFGTIIKGPDARPIPRAMKSAADIAADGSDPARAIRKASIADAEAPASQARLITAGDMEALCPEAGGPEAGGPEDFVSDAFDYDEMPDPAGPDCGWGYAPDAEPSGDDMSHSAEPGSAYESHDAMTQATLDLPLPHVEPDPLAQNSTMIEQCRESPAAEQPETSAAAIPLYAIDTETTGFYGNSKLTEIAIVDRAGRVVFQTLIDPGCLIPREVVRVTGITNAMVKGKPSYEEIWPQIARIITGAEIVFYNAAYDLRYLHGVADVAARVHCAFKGYKAWKKARGVEGGNKLTDAAATFGFNWQGKAHRAAADARATLAVWLGLATSQPATRTVAVSPEAAMPESITGSRDTNTGTDVGSTAPSRPLKSQSLAAFRRRPRPATPIAADNQAALPPETGVSASKIVIETGGFRAEVTRAQLALIEQARPAFLAASSWRELVSHITDLDLEIEVTRRGIAILGADGTRVGASNISPDIRLAKLEARFGMGHEAYRQLALYNAA